MKDTIQPQPSFSDRQSARLERIRADFGTGKELGYVASGHAWDVVEKVILDMKEEYKKRGEDPQVDFEILEILQSLSAAGPELKNQGRDIFRDRLSKWFDRAIAKARGLQDTSKAEQLAVRYQGMVRVLGFAEHEQTMLDALEKVNSKPISELIAYFSDETHRALYEKVLKSIVSLGGGSLLPYSEDGLSTQEDKDLYVLIYNALGQLALTDEITNLVEKITTDRQAGYYISAYQIVEILNISITDPKMIKSMWLLLDN